MRIRLLLLIFSLFILVGTALAGPEMAMSIEEFDFGQVPNRSVLHYSVWFRSVGDDTLRIYDIKTGCDCAVMPLERVVLPPGDSVLATLIWETERTHGLIRRFPRVFTNASPDPYRLKFYAMVLERAGEAQPIQVKPYRVIFSEFMGKTRDSIAFTLSNMDQVDYSILQVSPVSAYFEVGFPDSIKADGQVNGYVRLRKEMSDQKFEEGLTLQFNTKGREAKRFTIPVAHEIYTP